MLVDMYLTEDGVPKTGMADVVIDVYDLKTFMSREYNDGGADPITLLDVTLHGITLEK